MYAITVKNKGEKSMEAEIVKEELGTTMTNLLKMGGLLNRFSFTNLQFTKGVREIVEDNDAYWLLDAIWYSPVQRNEYDTIEWTLMVDDFAKSAVLRGYYDSKLVERQTFNLVKCGDMAFTQHYNAVALPGEIT